MLTRLPRPLAERVKQLAVQLDLSYNDTLAALIEIGLNSDQLPQRRQEVLPESA
jgi:hypothetical protein